MKQIGVVAILALSLGASLFVWMGRRSNANADYSQQTAQPSGGRHVPEGHPAVAEAVAPSTREEAPAALIESGTTSQTLEAYWGARWPGIRSELEADGYRLDRPFNQANLKSWDEARELLSRRIHDEFVNLEDANLRLQQFYGIGDDVTASFSEQYLAARARGLTDQEVRSRVAATAELRDVCRADYFAFRSYLAVVAQRRLHGADLPKAPFKIPRSYLPQPQTKPFLLKQSFSCADWSVLLEVYEGDDPTLDSMWSQFVGSVDAWQSAVKIALAR